MAWTLATATQQAMADAVGALPDGGSLELYTGAKPAAANDAATGTLLATFTLPADAFAAADVNGSVALNAGAGIAATAVADGTAGWGRFKTSAGATVVDGAVGTEFTLNTTSIVTNDTVTLLSGSLTVPSGA